MNVSYFIYWYLNHDQKLDCISVFGGMDLTAHQLGFFKPIVRIPIVGWMTLRTQSFKHFLNNALTIVHDAVVWYGLAWSELILMRYGVVCLWYGLI